MSNVAIAAIAVFLLTLIYAAVLSIRRSYTKTKHVVQAILFGIAFLLFVIAAFGDPPTSSNGLRIRIIFLFAGFVATLRCAICLAFKKPKQKQQIKTS